MDDEQYITGDLNGIQMRCDKTLLVDSSDGQYEWSAQLESVKFNATLFEIYGRNPDNSQVGPNLQLRSTYGDSGIGSRFCTFTMVNQRVPTNQDAGWKSSWQFYCGDYTSSSIGTLLMIGSDHDTAGTFDQTLLTLTGGTSNSTRELKVDGKLNVTGTTTFNDITLSGDASFGGSSIVIPTLSSPSDITSNIKYSNM